MNQSTKSRTTHALWVLAAKMVQKKCSQVEIRSALLVLPVVVLFARLAPCPDQGLNPENTISSNNLGSSGNMDIHNDIHNAPKCLQLAPLITYVYIPPTMLLILPLPSTLEQEGADDARSNTNATEDGDAHEPFPGDPVVDELPQVRGLHIGRFLIQQQVIVPAGLAVVAELVVSQGEVVEAFAASLGREAEYVGEEADAELLIVAVMGFHEALGGGEDSRRLADGWIVGSEGFFWFRCVL